MTNPVAVVTGGAGFIGSHLVELLVQEGFYVRVIDDLSRGSKSNLVNVSENHYQLFVSDVADNLDEELFDNTEVVFHLAGVGDIIPSITNPELYFRVNTLGTFNVLTAATKKKVKAFVYAASSSCYGNAKVPTNEDAEISLLHPYALTKYLGELTVLNWSRYYNMRTNSICIFNAYGRRFKTTGSYGSVLGVFVKQALENQPLTIAGDGSQTRDFVHVTDVCRAFLNAYLYGIDGNRYNIGSGTEFSILELANFFSEKHVWIPDRPGEAKRTRADITKASKDLFWKPSIKIEVGLQEIRDNMNDWQNAPLWNELSIAQQVAKWNEHLGNKAGGSD